MDLKRFGAMEKKGRNCVVHDRNGFERNLTLGAWMRRWKVFRLQYLEVLVDRCFVNMPFIQCAQKFSYCYRRWDATDATMKSGKKACELERWFLDSPHRNLYFTDSGTHWEKALMVEIRPKTAFCKLMFAECYGLWVFVASLKTCIVNTSP